MTAFHEILRFAAREYRTQIHRNLSKMFRPQASFKIAMGQISYRASQLRELESPL